MAVYGPAILAAAYPGSLGWLDQAVRDERAREIEERMEALRRESEALRSR